MMEYNKSKSYLAAIPSNLLARATYDEKRNPYFLALHAPKLIKRNEAGEIVNAGQAIISIAEIIVKVAFDCGQAIKGDVEMLVDGEKKNIKQLELLSTALLSEIVAIFPNATVEEIRMALHNYVRGEYGDFKGGLNIVSFNHAIRSFIKSSGRQEAKARLKTPEPVIDKVNSEQGYKEWVINQFKVYKETGVLNFNMPSYQFTKMEAWGLIVMTIEQKQAIIPTAKIKLFEAKKNARMQADKKERQSIEGTIRRIELGELNDNDNAELKREAREIAIKIYYDSITELPKF